MLDRVITGYEAMLNLDLDPFYELKHIEVVTSNLQMDSHGMVIKL